MMYYWLKLLINFILRRVSGDSDKNLQTDKTVAPEGQVTEGFDCSCIPVLSQGHPVDFKRLVRLFQTVYDSGNQLVCMLEPMKSFDPIDQLEYPMYALLEYITDECTDMRDKAKDAVELMLMQNLNEEHCVLSRGISDQLPIQSANDYYYRPPVFSNDNSPDLGRLLEIFKVVHDTVDQLFQILEPIHASTPLFIIVPGPDYELIASLELSIEACAGARYYVKKAIERLERLLRNEPVSVLGRRIHGGIVFGEEEQETRGLTRRILLLRQRIAN